MFHALIYSCHIFNVLPVKGLYAQGHVSTPFELFQGTKPKISMFRVFGCPITARKWTTKQNSASKQTQRVIHGIFIDFAENQKVFLFYSSASRQIYISGDMTFDESFSSTIATTWHLNRDDLALRPAASDIPDINTTLEHTGGVIDITDTALVPSDVVEGEDTVPTPALRPIIEEIENVENENIDADTSVDDCPELTQADNDSVSEADSMADSDDDDDLDDDHFLDLQQPGIAAELDISPQPVNVSRFGRIRKPNSRYAYQIQSYEWENNATRSEYQDLAHACAVESTPTLPNTNNALTWEPAPTTIRDIVKIPDGPAKQEWLKPVRKELKTLVDSNTFQEDKLHTIETSTPVMEIFKVKVQSDGSLDKLKTRLVVRGDLQNKNITEDKWSPTASF